jgi:hypothetical protein
MGFSQGDQNIFASFVPSRHYGTAVSRCCTAKRALKKRLSQVLLALNNAGIFELRVKRCAHFGALPL